MEGVEGAYLYNQHALNIIAAHNASTPLFMYLALQVEEGFYCGSRRNVRALLTLSCLRSTPVGHACAPRGPRLLRQSGRGCGAILAASVEMGSRARFAWRVV
jgi:hypothetical protein